MPVRNYLLRLLAAASMVATPAVAADQSMLPALPWLSASPPPPPPLAAKAAPIPDLEYFTPRPVPAWQAEFAARYWYGNATAVKSLYDPPSVSDAMIARSTYGTLTTDAGELYGHAAFTGGFFLQGYVGIASVSQGKLQEEYFPPYVASYATTLGNQHNGSLSYASADVGYDVVRGGDFRVGAFVGYHYFDEAMNGYGCAQTAGSAKICQPLIPPQFEVVSQNNHFQSLRVGLDGAVKLSDRLTLSAEAAGLPYVSLDGTDAHWLLIGTKTGDYTGPIPEDGSGWGYQLEALLSYQVTDYISVGLGGRYWHLQTDGETHYEGHVVGVSALAHPSDWKTDVYGAFLQTSIKLGPYPLGLH